MSFGRRGAAGPTEAGRGASVPVDMNAAEGPRVALDDGTTHVSQQWRSLAIKAVFGIVLVALFVGYNRFGHRLFAATDSGFYAGRPSQPYKMLEGADPQAWKFGSCWLDSTQFLDGDDHNLVFNTVGRLYPETTPDALEAASQFFSCVARKEAERLCDKTDRKAFVADIGTFYKRYDGTLGLVTGEIRATGIAASGANLDIGGPLGDRVKAAQANRRGKLIAKFEAMDDQVGRAIYLLIEGGVMTPADFSGLKAEQIRHHVRDLTAKPSICK